MDASTAMRYTLDFMNNKPINKQNIVLTLFSACPLPGPYLGHVDQDDEQPDVGEQGEHRGHAEHRELADSGGKENIGIGKISTHLIGGENVNSETGKGRNKE
jgi:hypothetical protein